MKLIVFVNNHYCNNVINLNHDYLQREYSGVGATDKKKNHKILNLNMIEGKISLAFSVFLLTMRSRYNGKAFWKIKHKNDVAPHYFTSPSINTQDKTLNNKWFKPKKTPVNPHNKLGIFLKQIGLTGKTGVFSKEYG